MSMEIRELGSGTWGVWDHKRQIYHSRGVSKDQAVKNHRKWSNWDRDNSDKLL